MEYNCEKHQNLVLKTKFSEPTLLLRKNLKVQCSGNSRIVVFKDFLRLRLCARKISPWKKNNKNIKQKCFTIEGRSREHFITNGWPGKCRRENCFDDDFMLYRNHALINICSSNC